MSRVAFSREAYGEEKLHQGRAEGRADERHEIALRMLKEGESDAKISRITGMTKKELALLKRGLKNK